MRFIRLTRHDGQIVVVNADRIEAMIPYDGFTSVCFVGTVNVLDVQENPDTIINVIKAAEEV